VKERLESVLKQKIHSLQALSGGSIADSYLLETNTSKFFCKSYLDKPEIIQAEVDGLLAIKKTKTIKTPKIIAYDSDILILEYIEQSSSTDKSMKLLGENLANMHLCFGESYGYERDNFIGRTPQKNTPTYKEWSRFYWDNRLKFQFDLLQAKGLLDSELESAASWLEKKINQILDGSEEKPSPIHGDLWSGNYLISTDQTAYLIDPAFCYAHRELELAMTKLFGGFTHEFYQLYNSIYPLIKGHEKREPVYTLYHLLNHINLFGVSYRGQSLACIKQLQKNFS